MDDLGAMWSLRPPPLPGTGTGSIDYLIGAVHCSVPRFQGSLPCGTLGRQALQSSRETVPGATTFAAAPE
jgi:hypothetical protein